MGCGSIEAPSYRLKEQQILDMAPMTNTTLLQLRDLSLGYEGRAVVEGLSLTIERGEFLALLGPDGAGNTTLLRGLRGSIPAPAGQLESGFVRLAHPAGAASQV